jgi:hypothetical protein
MATIHNHVEKEARELREGDIVYQRNQGWIEITRIEIDWWGERKLTIKAHCGWGSRDYCPGEKVLVRAAPAEIAAAATVDGNPGALLGSTEQEAN